MKGPLLLALLAALSPVTAVAAAPDLSGQYGPLLLAVTGEVVTGAFSEQRVGNGTDNAPQFSCVFLLQGHLNGSQAQVVTWYPGQPPIAGQMTLSADGVSLKLKDNQAGCGMTSGDMVDQAYETTRDSPGVGWIGTRLVAVSRAVLRSSPDVTAPHAPYVVQDDAVAVLVIQGDWVKVRYAGPDKASVGWVKATELTAASPPH
jgi:hypothetical protein